MANTQTGNAQGTLDLVDNLKAVLETVDSAQVGVLITAHPIYKVRSFYKWVQKKADFTVLAGGKDSAQTFVALIQVECEKAGVSITRDAIQLLIGKVNGNTRLIVEETRKLISFVGTSGESITARLVTDLVPNFGDADFFEAADAFYSLRLDVTLEALRRHFFTNSESRPLLGSLQSRNRLLIQLRVLLDAGAIRVGPRGIAKTDLDAAAQVYGEHYGEDPEKSNLNVFTQHPFYLGRLAGDASKVPLKRLVDFQIAFTEAFEAIIERPNEQEEVCRELAVRCLS